MSTLKFIFPLALCLSCTSTESTETTDSSEPEVDTDTGSSTPAFEPFPMEVVPGESIGGIGIGMTYSEVVDILGEPDQSITFERTITLQYAFKRLEILFTSSFDDTLSEDSKVRAVATMTSSTLVGDILLNVDRKAIEDLGEINIESESRQLAYITEIGLGIKFNSSGLVSKYSVWPPYGLEPTPPEMIPAQTYVENVDTSTGENDIFYEINGQPYEVVDIHLHVSEPSSQIASGVSFLVSQLPEQAILTFPASAPLTLDPYGEHLGIQEHLKDAGVAHGVLLATYTHHTIGYAENRLLEEMLDDPRNVNPNGSQWAWGMASVNYDDFEDESIAADRYAALSSYFEQRPDLFIGIKLAHAHQAVSFDDPIYMGVYDVAADNGVPVLLHTGFSPFPNTMSEPEYYDPSSLEAVVQAYDGQHGLGKVDFVLSHVGQGDARAIEHSLEMAEKYDNVWLELSAINRPLLINEYGEPVDSDAPMHEYVLSQIKERDLVSKAIFATDGPQYFGKVQNYLGLLTDAMVELGYTSEDLEAVLAGNFYNCYAPNDR